MDSYKIVAYAAIAYCDSAHISILSDSHIKSVQEAPDGCFSSRKEPLQSWDADCETTPIIILIGIFATSVTSSNSRLTFPFFGWSH